MMMLGVAEGEASGLLEGEDEGLNVFSKGESVGFSVVIDGEELIMTVGGAVSAKEGCTDGLIVGPDVASSTFSSVIFVACAMLPSPTDGFCVSISSELTGKVKGALFGSSAISSIKSSVGEATGALFDPSVVSSNVLSTGGAVGALFGSSVVSVMLISTTGEVVGVSVNVSVPCTGANGDVATGTSEGTFVDGSTPIEDSKTSVDGLSVMMIPTG
jgi:hypothetical protein